MCCKTLGGQQKWRLGTEAPYPRSRCSSEILGVVGELISIDAQMRPTCENEKLKQLRLINAKKKVIREILFPKCREEL